MEHKLKYADRETAITDLLARGIYVEQTVDEETTLQFGEGVQAIVEAGIICLTYPTYDEEMNELTPAVYADGYHFDILTTNTYDFGAVEIFPKNPRFMFLGINETDETVEPII